MLSAGENRQIFNSDSPRFSLSKCQRQNAPISSGNFEDIPTSVYLDNDRTHCATAQLRKNVRKASVPAIMGDRNILNEFSSPKSVAQCAQENRLKQRLEACRTGLQKLDMLRSKHQRLMQGMRSQLGLESYQIDEECSSQASTSDLEARIPSPAPSSSNISHRSSLSMDSGFISMSSDGSYQLTGLGGSRLSLISRQRASVISTSDCGVGVKAESENERSFDSDESGRRTPTGDEQSSSSDHLPLLASVIEASAAPEPEPKQRRKASSSISVCGRNRREERPKSLFNYPEENTVFVESIPMPPAVVKICNSSPKIARSPRITRSESVQVVRPRSDFATERASESRDLRHAPVPRRSHSTAAANNESAARAAEKKNVYRASCVFIDPERGVAAPSVPKHQHTLPLPSKSQPNLSKSPRTNTLNRKAPLTPPCVRRQTLSRPQSIALGPNSSLSVDNFENHLSLHRKTTQTTWEDVKRMLDPLFEERKAEKADIAAQKRPSRIPRAFPLVKSNSTANPTSTIYMGKGDDSPTIRRLAPTNNGCSRSVQNHLNLSRSISSQSSDSNKSSTSAQRKKEKPWHESERL